MPKTIIIGSCSVNIVFPDDVSGLPAQATATTGGLLLDTAISLGRQGHQTVYVSEVARDALGDILLTHLQACGVDTRHIDRFAEGGATTLNAIFSGSSITYSRTPATGFDTVWPRINSDDTVVFGGNFALDPRTRIPMLDILHHAAERKAIIVYIPDFPERYVPRITHFKPAVIENFEIADIIIATPDDLSHIFGNTNPADCYRRDISFYCDTLFTTGVESTHLQHSSTSLTVPATSIASLLHAITSAHLTKGQTPHLSSGQLKAITDLIDTSI